MMIQSSLNQVDFLLHFALYSCKRYYHCRLHALLFMTEKNRIVQCPNICQFCPTDRLAKLRQPCPLRLLTSGDCHSVETFPMEKTFRVFALQGPDFPCSKLYTLFDQSLYPALIGEETDSKSNIIYSPESSPSKAVSRILTRKLPGSAFSTVPCERLPTPSSNCTHHLNGVAMNEHGVLQQLKGRLFHPVRPIRDRRMLEYQKKGLHGTPIIVA